MKILPLILSSAVVWSSQSLSAASLMLDFGNPTATASGTNANPGPVAAGTYLTLSPGHSLGGVASGETTWNTITTSSANSGLNYSDGSTATGITLTLGQESTAGNNTIDYATSISNLTLIGTGGGTNGQKSLITSGSIYGDTRLESSAVGRDAFFGGGSASAGSAIGFRVDGLAAGDYVVYLMGRNTNSNNTPLIGMTFHATTGTSSGTFASFDSAASAYQANTNYATVDYTNQYESFAAGENYVALSISIADGESLFVAVDGTDTETRGFLNMAQIVAVPEPAAALLGAFGMLTMLRRRR